MESGSPPNRRYSRFTTSPSARNALLGPQIARWGCEPGQQFYSVLGVEAAATTRKWTLLAVCLTTFMLLLDITVVVVALPSMQQRFDASLTGLQWVVDAYALSLAALILTAGALADRYGRRLVFIAGVLLFTLSSLLCGLAWSITALDVARALQGIGGAALFATALALIGHEYRGPDRFGALSVWGATVGAAVACGGRGGDSDGGGREHPRLAVGANLGASNRRCRSRLSIGGLRP